MAHRNARLTLRGRLLVPTCRRRAPSGGSPSSRSSGRAMASVLSRLPKWITGCRWPRRSGSPHADTHQRSSRTLRRPSRRPWMPTQAPTRHHNLQGVSNPRLWPYGAGVSARRSRRHPFLSRRSRVLLSGMRSLATWS